MITRKVRKGGRFPERRPEIDECPEKLLRERGVWPGLFTRHRSEAQASLSGVKLRKALWPRERTENMAVMLPDFPPASRSERFPEVPSGKAMSAGGRNARADAQSGFGCGSPNPTGEVVG